MGRLAWVDTDLAHRGHVSKRYAVVVLRYAVPHRNGDSKKGRKRLQVSVQVSALYRGGHGPWWEKWVRHWSKGERRKS